ncbi:bifunctional DNA primase/polymerase [Roseiconus lacunae]|uniref:Bifunctional DNA primase/polymerase n=1 Tax=Roseiconus lacunae TaxID=2605694 RepID=A0ABT7PDY0_9BACT|nr:bifunctional DNA primase/polymerase [Roseiconus lacunae]MDM4014691.1 bifunctional DNA primase/polymerase [Roseiconus lacunae]
MSIADAVLYTARCFTEGGLSVIPLRLDGTKRPAIRSWEPYQDRIATDDELVEWFREPKGLGIVAGVVSGGLEVFDFDLDPLRVFNSWWEQLPSDIRGKLPVCETGGGGFHVLYRCCEVTGNKKIAFPADRSKPYVETRGEGGYIVATGSPLEVHTSGSPYMQTMGLPLPDLPILTANERATLWRIARSFDESEQAKQECREHLRRQSPTVVTEVDTSTPWGAFDVEAKWSDILTPHGWTSQDGERWMRPGKKFGPSARVNIATNGCEVLTVYSSSAGPLAPVGTYQTWGKFSAFAALNHSGNRSEAAKAVRQLGYGRAAA